MKINKISIIDSEIRKTKHYVHENVSYYFNRSDRKWRFNVGSNIYILICPGGAETAHKFAIQINAGHKRTFGNNPMDGIARKKIADISTSVLVESQA
jgi:hypothetical protein